MTNCEEIRCIKGIVAENLISLGWIQGAFERKGKYCLVGMVRCVVLDYESEWMAECGEGEMTPDEFKLYRQVLTDICREAGIDTAGKSADDLSIVLQNFNDNKCEKIEDVLAVLS